MEKRVRPAELLAATVMIVVCAGGKAIGVMPFATPMYCALCDAYFCAVAPVYVLCSYLFTFSVWRVYSSGAVVFVTAGRLLLCRRVRAMGGRAAKTLISLGAMVAEAVISALFVPVAAAGISLFLAAVFYAFAVRAAELVKTHCAYRPDEADGAAVFAVLVVAGTAFARARVGELMIGLSPAMLILLFLCAAGGKAAIVGGGALAVGMGLEGGGALVPPVLCAALCLVALARLPRIVSALMAIAVYAAAAVVFGMPAEVVGWSALLLAAGALPFLCLPPRAVRRLRDYFDYDRSSRLAVRHYINRTKTDAGNGMLAVASVFDETSRLLGALSPPTPDADAVGCALMERLCPGCPRHGLCDERRARQAFCALAERAHTGRAVLPELPDFFTRECARVSDVLSGGGEMSERARERLAERNAEQKARTIVTEQLSAVKEVLTRLAAERALPVGFDGEAEERIAAELCSRGVETAEVLCTRDGVTAVVRTETASRRKIAAAARATLKRDYEVTIERTQAAGWSVATLKRLPAYDAVYARAGVGKEGVSGDSYTFRRIGDRFLTALLDGMGTGSDAAKTSGAAVELIECFYRAGFGSGSVISGVNRFLKLPASESYSAADVAVCDLDSATVDIIKLGSPPCFIKTEDTVLKIEGSALPIGVLDELTPFVTTKRLYPGQMLVLVTDGVSDCFCGDELPELINGLSAFNPERTVRAILERALLLCGGAPRDDMTAIAIRLFDAPRKKYAAA